MGLTGRERKHVFSKKTGPKKSESTPDRGLGSERSSAQQSQTGKDAGGEEWKWKRKRTDGRNS
jgi:hypothetical protein